MTIQEFADKYYLHDSSIEKITFDASKKLLTIKISFCFWMQDWFDKNSPTNGSIRVTFNDVTNFEYDDDIADRIFDELDSEIRNAELDDDGGLKFFSVETIYDSDSEDIYWQLKINAASVEVKELERYNL